MKNICEICKELINKTPKWVTNPKVGMELESWYYWEKKWNKRDKHCNKIILKVDDNLVYYHTPNNVYVSICLIDEFIDGYSLLTK